jgi:hypothetical protein
VVPHTAKKMQVSLSGVVARDTRTLREVYAVIVASLRQPPAIRGAFAQQLYAAVCANAAVPEAARVRSALILSPNSYGVGTPPDPTLDWKWSCKHLLNRHYSISHTI